MTWYFICGFLSGLGFAAAALLLTLRHYLIREEQARNLPPNPHQDDPRLSAVLNVSRHPAGGIE